MLINNNQASAPGTTPTPVEATGPLFADLVAGTIVRYEVRDNTAGTFTALTKDTGGAWHVDGTNTLAGRDPDQSLITTTAGQIASIQYNNTFTDDKLDTFGLASPSYTVIVTTDAGLAYTIYVGAKAPTSSRYYAVVQQSAIPAATAEATTEPGTFDVQPGEAIATQNITGQNANEEGVLPPDANATSEPTAEATAAPASKRIFQAATSEPTAEVTQQAVATENVEGQNANESGVVPSGTATVESAAAATAEMMAAATTEATAESTAAATASVIQAPGVTLTGQQTIYVIPQTVIDTLKRWLTTPPYAPVPTAAPTSEFTPEATAPATAESTAEAIGVNGTVQPTPLLEEGSNPQLIPAGTPIATQEATPEATAAS
jgi:hypothetical protein